jgi:hypothetical protein
MEMQPVEVSQKLLDAFADTGLKASDFKTTEQEIAMSVDGSEWTDDKGNVLVKNSKDSYDIRGPQNQ